MGPNPRPLCPTKVYFGQQWDFYSTLSSAVLSQNTISTRATYDFHDRPADAIRRTMKTKTSIHIHSIPRLLLMVPVICSMAFAACSEAAGTAGPHPTVNLQSAVVGRPQTGDNVTIGPRTYNSETRSFDRPWPFGPEFNPQ
jgi:hypothetical protein